MIRLSNTYTERSRREGRKILTSKNNNVQHGIGLLNIDQIQIHKLNI